MNANYVCISGGRYEGYNEDGERFALPISDGDKVKINFDLMPYNPYIGGSTISFQRLGDSYDGDKYVRICTERSIIYIKQDNIDKCFRPIVHKHIATVAFYTVEEMNKWLIDKPVNSIKDIKVGPNTFLVMYIDNGDD